MKRRTLLPLGWILLGFLPAISCQFQIFEKSPSAEETFSLDGPAGIHEGTPLAVIENVPMEQPLLNLLVLREIRISLETVRPDGSGFNLVAEVDTSGNSHILKTYLGESPGRQPTPANDGTTFPSSVELIVVQGIAYISDNKGGYKKIVGSESASTLEALLQSPDGPGLWVSILPKESLQAEGSEQKGGFTTQKYTIQGEIEGNKLTGILWLDTESGALIGADLQIPAALYGPFGTNNAGSVTIKLNVSNAAIAPITAPEE
jgi:hypothetical protein